MAVPDRAQMMEIWKIIAPESNKTQATTKNKGYLTLVAEHMKENPDISKAMAMRAVTAKYPEKHEAWIRSVQK